MPMKRVLIISTSRRENSNSAQLAKQFQRGAQEAGHEVQYISLKGKHIQFCLGCLSCQKTGRCVIVDDMKPIVEAMKKADVLVFATPIYYYEMSGSMKVFLDRSNPLYVQNYAFRDVYLLVTAADENRYAFKRCQSGLEGWIECFSEATLRETVFAGAVVEPGDVVHHPALQDAYEMGKRV